MPQGQPTPTETRAEVLAYSRLTSDENAAEEYGVSVRSVRRWRKQQAKDKELASLVADLVEAERSDRIQAINQLQYAQGCQISEIQAKQSSLLEDLSRACKNAYGRQVVAYTERHLQNFLHDHIREITKQVFGWAPETSGVEVTLPTGCRVDIVAQSDERCLVCEVKSTSNGLSSAGQYSPVGQVLYYAEIMQSTTEFGLDRLHILILSDYEPYPFALSSVRRIPYNAKWKVVSELSLDLPA